MPSTPITDWGDAVLTSIASALALFLGAIPKVIGFLVILIIGWLVAGAIAAAVAALLRSVKFNDLAQRSGFAGFVRTMGVQTDAAGFIATVTKWFVRLITLVVAFDALGLPAVSQVLQQLLLWLPNLVVALVILVVAGLAANALHGLVRGAAAEGGFGNPSRRVDWANHPMVNETRFMPSWVSGLIAPTTSPQLRSEILWEYSQAGPGVYHGDCYFYAFEMPEIAKELGPATCPLYVLSGEYDYSATPAMSEHAAGQLGGKFILMEKMGHFPMSEEPERFARYVGAIVNELVHSRIGSP